MPDVLRVVAVESPGPRCSGFVIADRLVLASAHGTPEEGQAVMVRPATAHQPFRGTVVWRGRPGGVDDAALVRVEDERWSPPDGRTPQFGRLVTRETQIAAQVQGFPQWVERAAGAGEVWQSTATINPGSLYVGDRYALALNEPEPDPGKPWKGLSGAAVFCGALLTGVVIADMAGGRHQYLQAVPLVVLLRNARFRQVLLEHGVRPTTTAVEFADAQALEPPVQNSPANLLRPRSQVVRFRGRRDLMRRLQAWCVGSGFGAWLLHGPGGQGKTRVAQELADRVTAEQWAVLWLDESAPAACVAAISSTVVPLLVMIDYAECRPGQLAAVLRACAYHGGTQPLRLLLLARSDGDWWDALRTDRTGLVDCAVSEALDVLDAGTAGRAEAYRQAVTDLAAAMAAMPAHRHHDWPSAVAQLTACADVPPDDGSALGVQMRALADLLDSAYPVDEVTDPQEPVEARIIRHEKRYWQQAANAQALYPGLTYTTLFGALAVAMLFGAETVEQAEHLLLRLPTLSDQPYDRRDAVRRWIARLYPSESSAWGSLQPDRLLEWFIGSRLAQDARLVDAAVPVAGENRNLRMVTIYAQAAEHAAFRGGLDQLLTDLCTRHSTHLAPVVVDVTMTVRRPAPLVGALYRLLDEPVTDFQWFTDLLDRANATSQSLGTWAAEATEHLAAYWLDVYRFLLDSPEQSAEQVDAVAMTLCQTFQLYAVRLRALGLPEAAASASSTALDFLQQGDLTSPYGRRLTAGVLHNLALALSDLGLPHEAVQQAEAAVDILTSSATADVDLALTLNSLAVMRSAVGRTTDALDAADRALRIYRDRCRADPDKYVHELAMVLSNRSNWLSGVREYEAAGEASAESVAIRRSLARTSPDIHLPGLASSLDNHATNLACLERSDESLQTAQEAVAIRRTLAAGRPAAHLAGLALSLHNLGRRLAAAGQPEEALEAADESVDIYRRLHAERPDVYAPELARALNGASEHLHDLDRSREALETVSEAIALYATISREAADAFAPGLAQALRFTSKLYRTLNEHAEAVEHGSRAVAIYRRLAETRPGEYVLTLFLTLHEVAYRLADLGKHGQAVEVSAEAVHLARTGLADRTTDYLVVALARHAAFLAGAGRDDDALEAAREGVSLASDLAEEVPAVTGLADLAALLDEVAVTMRETGETAFAEYSSASSLVVYRRLAERSERFLPSLARALITHANYLGEARYPQAALETVTEAIVIARRIGDDEPEDEPDLLGRCLHARFAALQRLGRPEEALAAITEAVPRIRRQAEAHPQWFTVDLAETLYAMAIGQYETGATAAALLSATEAMAVWQTMADEQPETYAAEMKRLRELIDVVQA